MKAFPHHQEWVNALECLTPSAPHLMIICPPGHAKTTWMGIFNPAFQIGVNPDLHIGYISNSATQAHKQSIAVRDTTLTTGFQEVFPGIQPDYGKGWSKDKWYVKRKDASDNNPTFLAAGLFGPVLGARFDLLILDDVFDEEVANSETLTKRARSWIRRTAMTRLKPGAHAICILTRWNPDDLAAEFLNDSEWNVVHMPAIGYWGENMALWPEWMPLEKLLVEKARDPISFEGIYQGNPTVEEGQLIKRGWWKWANEDSFPSRESFDLVVQAWDTAFKANADADYSVCITAGRYKGNIYILDVYREKVEWPDLLKASRKLYGKHLPSAVLIEDAASGQCYSDDTEVLTRRGWIRFTDIDISSDEFATRNPETKYFEWQKALAETHELYDGKMCHFYSRTLDVLVTPEHRMLVQTLPKDLGGNAYRKGEVIVGAKDLVGRPIHQVLIPITSKWKGSEIADKVFQKNNSEEITKIRKKKSQLDTKSREALNLRVRLAALSQSRRLRMTGDQYCAFMGAYLSEGWLRIQPKHRQYSAFISQRKRGSDAFKAFGELCESITGEAAKFTGRDFRIGSRALVEHLRQFGDRAYNKFIPEEIMNATSRQIQIFLKYYLLGDGCVKTKVYNITTTSKRMTDQLMELCQKIGFSAYCYVRHPNKPITIGNNKKPTPPENRRTVYRVSIRRSRTMAAHSKIEHYKGMTHCVSVPNGVIYVRRNNKPCWCGQSLIQSLRLDVQPMIPVIPSKRGDSDTESFVRSKTSWIQGGRVWLKKNSQKATGLVAECAQFPRGKDDQVLALAHLLKYMTAGIDSPPLDDSMFVRGSRQFETGSEDDIKIEGGSDSNCSFSFGREHASSWRDPWIN